MLLLTCPNCGPRNVSEFRFGNEYNPRPADPATVSDDEWVDYLHLHNNKVGVQTEWWHHGTGCGLWLLAERDTKTSEVLRTYLWGHDGDPETDSEGGNES